MICHYIHAYVQLDDKEGFNYELMKWGVWHSQIGKKMRQSIVNILRSHIFLSEFNKDIFPLSCASKDRIAHIHPCDYVCFATVVSCENIFLVQFTDRANFVQNGFGNLSKNLLN